MFDGTRGRGTPHVPLNVFNARVMFRIESLNIPISLV